MTFLETCHCLLMLEGCLHQCKGPLKGRSLRSRAGRLHSTSVLAAAHKLLARRPEDDLRRE